METGISIRAITIEKSHYEKLAPEQRENIFTKTDIQSQYISEN